jgi:hypothetical protein
MESPSTGSAILSWGIYDSLYPGGVRPLPAGPAPETELNTVMVDLLHGFVVRCVNIDAWKGVEIVLEPVLYDIHGIETGLFGAGVVTTHNFSVGDYAAAHGAVGYHSGAFVTALTGIVTEIGGTVLPSAPGILAELFRVTVSLIDMAGGLHQQFQDIFPAQLADAAIHP